jgi:hypothetical protein
MEAYGECDCFEWKEDFVAATFNAARRIIYVSSLKALRFGARKSSSARNYPKEGEGEERKALKRSSIMHKAD